MDLFAAGAQGEPWCEVLGQRVWGRWRSHFLRANPANPIKPLPRGRSLPGLAAIWICALVTLVLGFYPAPLSQATREAAFPTPALEPRAGP